MASAKENSIFLRCTEQSSDSDNILQCISDSLQAETKDVSTGIDTFFLIFSAALVFLMQAGFAMLCAGSVRQKNVKNSMLKNLLDACGAAVGFWSVGYAFAYGGSEYGGGKTFIGNTNFFLVDVDDYSDWIFQYAFAATSATIVAGTLAERCQMTAYILYSILLTGFVFPVVAHSIWSVNGFLSPRSADPLWGTGVVDFAGSGVVHITGGFTALIASKILGPRKGRFRNNQGEIIKKPQRIQGHSVSLQVLGTFILWFGWYGFNTGSTYSIASQKSGNIAATTAVATTLGAASGGISALFFSAVAAERSTGEVIFDILHALNGCLSGLVSITASCSVIEPWAAVLIGTIAGILYLLTSSALVHLKIDDAVDAIPVHMTNGMWGLIAAGLFATSNRLEEVFGRGDHSGWFYSLGRGSSDATLLATQLVGLLFILGWVFFIVTPIFLLLSYLGWFRSDVLDEIVGLDLSYHGGSMEAMGKLKEEHMRTLMQRKKRFKDTEISTSFDDV